MRSQQREIKWSNCALSGKGCVADGGVVSQVGNQEQAGNQQRRGHAVAVWYGPLMSNEVITSAQKQGCCCVQQRLKMWQVGDDGVEIHDRRSAYTAVQWLVPAERVILLYTLYLPDGLFIGMRFISSSVAAS